MAGRRPAAHRRGERLEALLAGGQASLERARSRSLVVDTVVDVVRRERPVAVGILAASLAFRLFALVIPLIYVLVAGLGFAGTAADGSSRLGRGDHLGALVVDSIAAAARTSDRGHWLALLLGGLATLVAGAGVVEVLRWIHVLAWGVRPSRARPSARLVLGLVGGVLVVVATSTVAERTRADAKGLASELAVILATAAAQVVVLAVLWLALSSALPHPVAAPWTALVPGGAAVRRWLPGLQPGRHPVLRPAGGARLHPVRVARGGPDPAGHAVPVRPPGRGRRRAQRHPVGAAPRPWPPLSRGLSAGGCAPLRHRSRDRTAGRGRPGASPSR